jgi:putative glutamine amidotransferase
VEAVRVRDAPGFAWGVQWHPEYDWERDAFSRAIFEAFGAACRQSLRPRYEQAAAE